MLTWSESFFRLKNNIFSHASTFFRYLKTCNDFQLTQIDEFRDRLFFPQRRVAALVEEHHQHIEQRFRRETFGLLGVYWSFEKKSFQTFESVDPVLADVFRSRGIVWDPVRSSSVHGCCVGQGPTRNSRQMAMSWMICLELSLRTSMHCSLDCRLVLWEHKQHRNDVTF